MAVISGLISATQASTDGGKVVLKGQEAADISGAITAQRGSLGGQIHASFGTAPGLIPHVKGGKVKAGDLVKAAQGVDKQLISGVQVFDVYEGKGIDEAKKSVAIAVTLQPKDKTLTDAEIDAVAAKIVAEVAKKTGGTLRA